VVRLPVTKQAADVALTTDAYTMARAHMGEAAVVVVSRDRELAPMLRYLTSIGVFTILVTPHRAQRAAAAAASTPFTWDGDAVAGACCAVLTYDAAAGAVTAAWLNPKPNIITPNS